MKTVEFTKAHNYGGLRYEEGDKLELPEDRAKDLEDAGVIKKSRAKSKD